jgi:hypothetical protein
MQVGVVCGSGSSGVNWGKVGQDGEFRECSDFRDVSTLIEKKG